MISEIWWIGKDLVRSGRGLILRYYSSIRLKGLKKTTKNFNQDSQSPGPRTEPGTSRIRSSVDRSTAMKNSEDFMSQCGRLCRNMAIIIKCQDFRKARSALSSIDHVFISSGIRSRSCWRLFKRFNTWNSHSYKVLNILKICKEKMLSYMRRDWVQTNCNWSSQVFLLKAVTQFCHHDINFFDETGYSNCRYKKTAYQTYLLLA
jgi:hypothetical protein